jgi:glycosyltransferase involved in cell wall biosynthesis
MMTSAKKLKILMVTAYYMPARVYGGPVTALHRLNRELLGQGHEVTVYTTDANGTGNLAVPRGREVSVEGVPVWYFRRWWFGRTRKPFTLFFSRDLAKKLNTLRPGDYDLIYQDGGFTDVGRLAARAARRTGTPCVYHTGGSFTPWALEHKYWKKRIYLSLVERRILLGAGGFLVRNQAETGQLRRLGCRSLIRSIPIGVDLQGPQETLSRRQLEEWYPSLRGRPFLLFLGRLHPVKGLDLLIPAFAELARQFPEWMLVLAGPDEGGYLVKVNELIQNHQLTDRVLLTGMVVGERKSVLLGQTEFLVLPSYSEAFGVVMVEALGYGKPVIITTTCYHPEVAHEGVGLVVPPEKEPLARALREMMASEDLRRSCSAKVPEMARRHYSWEAIAGNTVDFFQEVITAAGNLKKC